MKEGSWTLRFQKSDIKRTHGLPQMGQKFLWVVACVLCCLPTLKGGKKKRLLLMTFLIVFFLSEWRRSCEVLQTENRHRVSKELFTERWMGTGDMRWSHPVTICMGVMLAIQIGHRCSGLTRASMQIFWCGTTEMVSATVHEMSSGFMTCQIFLHVHLCFSLNSLFVSSCELPVFVFLWN